MSDAPAAAEAPSGPKAPKGPLILALVNTLAVVAALGTLAYTRVIYKRPQITEKAERERLASLYAKPTAPPAPGFVKFDTFVATIQPIPGKPKPADGTQTQVLGKPHYASIGMVIEVRDIEEQGRLLAIKPFLMDQILSMLGKKAFHELTSVQGRYVLRTQIVDLANALIAKLPADFDPSSFAPAKPAGGGGDGHGGGGDGHGGGGGDGHGGGGGDGHGGGGDGHGGGGGLLSKKKHHYRPGDVIVTNVYFNEFIVQ